MSSLSFQLSQVCVDVLVSDVKECILEECPGMIAANDTESRCLVQLPYKYPKF